MGYDFSKKEALLLVEDEGPRKIRTYVASNPEAAVNEFLKGPYPNWILSEYFGRFPEGFISETGFRDFMGTCVLYYSIGWISHRKVMVEALSKMERKLKKQ